MCSAILIGTPFADCLSCLTIRLLSLTSYSMILYVYWIGINIQIIYIILYIYIYICIYYLYIMFIIILSEYKYYLLFSPFLWTNGHIAAMCNFHFNLKCHVRKLFIYYYYHYYTDQYYDHYISLDLKP